MVSYLASDSAYQTVRRLQLASRIIPVVGDLAGSKALPEIAEFLRDRAAFRDYMRSPEHAASHARIPVELDAAITLERLEHLHTYEVVAR